MDSWWKLKKILENDFLADSLKEYITYYRTMFRPKTRFDKEDNFYTGIMNIKYDNDIIFSADNMTYFDKGYDKLEGGIFDSPNNKRHNKITNYNMENVLKVQIESAINNAVYYKDFREYLDRFINMSINDSLSNQNPVYRMLAILDKRVGKRTLEKIMINYKNEPEWLQKIIEIRLNSEGLIKNTNLKHKKEDCKCCNYIDNFNSILFENDTCVCVEDENSILVGACYIIPRAHKETPFDLTDKEWNDTKKLIEMVKDYLEQKYKPDGYNLGWNIGQVGGQYVNHSHLHVIPRYKDEPLAGKGVRHWLMQEKNKRKKQTFI